MSKERRDVDRGPGGSPRVCNIVSGRAATRRGLEGKSLPRRLRETSAARRSTHDRQLALHGVALAALLLVLLPFFDDGYIASPDEGIYSAQAVNLSNGAWSSPRPAPAVDPTGAADGLTGATVEGRFHIPYARHPLYPRALGAAYSVAGTTGLVLVSVAGTWLAAAACALLAGRLDERLAIPALWLAGLGSPLLFDAYWVVGHAAAAGFSGLLLLALAWVIDDRRWWALTVAMPAALVLSMLRTEGTLVVAVVGGVIGLSALRLRPRFSLDWGSALVGAGVLATGGAGFLLDRWWYRSIVESASAGTAAIDRRSNLFTAAWNDLVRPWTGALATPSTAMVVILLAVPLAAIALRLMPTRPLLPVAAIGVAALAAVARHAEGLALISGLTPAFPLLLAGLILLPGRTLRSSPSVRLAAISVLGVILIAATSYGEGGVAQWGGRFYHLLLPAMIPLCLVGLQRSRDLLPRAGFVVAAASALVLTGSLSALALRTNAESRSLSRNAVETTMLVAARTQGDRKPLIVSSPLEVSGFSRTFWREISVGTDVLTTRGLGGLPRLLEAAHAGGYEEVVVITNATKEHLETLAGRTLAELEWQTLESTRSDDDRFLVLRLGGGSAAD